MIENDSSLENPSAEKLPVRASQPKQFESPGAELAANSISKTPVDLHGRAPVEGIAIDGAPADSPMDRDDAARVRYAMDAKRGPLTILDVSIADVASVSPRPAFKEADSRLRALDEAAFAKGESMYFNHGVRPMLPRRMQHRLSLENGETRPTVTTSVWYDKDYNVVHTEFSRTYLKSRCVSYRDAARQIQSENDSDPHIKELKDLSVLADRLLKRKSGVTNFPTYDPLTGTYVDSEGGVRHINPDELSAFTTVQGSMIAANEAAAGVMKNSNFMFRNHKHSQRVGEGEVVFHRKSDKLRFEAGRKDEADVPAIIGRPMQNKAEYSQQCLGHFGLDAETYCHQTSPMRRYADLANQRMMHWAIDVVDAITDSIMDDPQIQKNGLSRKAVSYAIWDNAQELLGKATQFKEAEPERKNSRRHALQAAIAETITNIPGTKGAPTGMISKLAARAINAIDLPYTSQQMGAAAKQLNETLIRNRATRREAQYKETEAWLNQVFPTPERKLLREWMPDSFAKLLRGAALRGDNHPVFAQEVIERLDADKDTQVQNLYTLLVVAQAYKGALWRDLKKEAFQRLKDNPALGEKVFAYMEAQNDAPPVYVAPATLFDRGRKSSSAALVVVNHEGIDYSAPFLDFGESPEKARQLAILSFFRYYGDMYPHKEQYTPKMIEMALARAKVKKGENLELLKEMCGGFFSVQTEYQPEPADKTRMVVTVKVTSNDGNESLSKSHMGQTGNVKPDAYEDGYRLVTDKAASKLLWDNRFFEMVSQCHTFEDHGKPGVAGKDEAQTSVAWADSFNAIDRRPPTLPGNR